MVQPGLVLLAALLLLLVPRNTGLPYTQQGRGGGQAAAQRPQPGQVWADSDFPHSKKADYSPAVRRAGSGLLAGPALRRTGVPGGMGRWARESQERGAAAGEERSVQ